VSAVEDSLIRGLLLIRASGSLAQTLRQTLQQTLPVSSEGF